MNSVPDTAQGLQSAPVSTEDGPLQANESTDIMVPAAVKPPESSEENNPPPLKKCTHVCAYHRHERYADRNKRNIAKKERKRKRKAAEAEGTAVESAASTSSPWGGASYPEIAWVQRTRCSHVCDVHPQMTEEDFAKADEITKRNHLKRLEKKAKMIEGISLSVSSEDEMAMIEIDDGPSQDSLGNDAFEVDVEV